MNAQSISNPSNILPKNINGWVPLQEDRTYMEDNLYDYIDGGAELFLSYGFKKVFNRIYTRINQPEIFVDIFFMNTSKDAFGVFTNSRESIENQWGAGSLYSQGAILFWKANVYVSILTNPETPEAKATIFELAKIIDEAITEESLLPEVLERLPKDKLIPESIRYFRHHIWLNSFYYVSHDNLLNISQETEAALAKYDYGNNHPILVVVEYPDLESAKTAYNKFTVIFVPESQNGEPYKIEDGTYIASSQKDSIIYIVFGSADAITAIELHEKTKKK